MSLPYFLKSFSSYQLVFKVHIKGPNSPIPWMVGAATKRIDPSPTGGKLISTPKKKKKKKISRLLSALQSAGTVGDGGTKVPSFYTELKLTEIARRNTRRNIKPAPLCPNARRARYYLHRSYRGNEMRYLACLNQPVRR